MFWYVSPWKVKINMDPRLKIVINHDKPCADCWWVVHPCIYSFRGMVGRWLPHPALSEGVGSFNQKRSSCEVDMTRWWDKRIGTVTEAKGSLRWDKDVEPQDWFDPTYCVDMLQTSIELAPAPWAWGSIEPSWTEENLTHLGESLGESTN